MLITADKDEYGRPLSGRPSDEQTRTLAILKDSMLLLAAANALNLGVSAGLTFFSFSVESTLAVASIVEAGLLMIIAGGIDFSASIFPSKIRQHIFKSGKEWSSKEHKKAEVSAAKYLVAGALLLIESFAIGAL